MSGEWPYESALLGYRACSSCEREHHVSHMVDGVCFQCLASDPEDYRRQEYERDKERRAKGITRLHHQTADVLRKLAGDRGLNPTMARVLREEAERLDGDASGVKGSAA